ncbi:MAG TPA: DNA mismatch repair endonuclease MutL, partial [Chitinophagales bacterium]|nr:DNA mismatch repair endonuclease MutL [Chitinophagales bacterium]
MSDIIHLLPDSIANQIAAGEVIQRPASAVKELLENSIDAGSTAIRLIIRDAGKTLIQVVDNGCGMSETDARLSFERHATSKIRTIEDLFAIRTMGFRGEALASIAAVAQVEMKTKKTEDEIGTLLIIEGSEVKSQEPCHTPGGTSISVKNLFYNVPARRNFLRSNPVEMRHIIEEFQRIALAHPDIFFTLTHNDMEIFHLRPGNLRQRITSVFGSGYNERLVPVDEQTGIVKIYGFVGKPGFARRTRGEQYFFVNGRFIRNHYLSHAVFINFEELIPDGSYPFFVLFIDLDPASIDINVHPTKQEIKFEDEKLVYGFVRAAVRHALARYSVTPTLDFEQEQSLNQIQSQFLRNPVAAAAETPYERPPAFTSAATTPHRMPPNPEPLYEISADQESAEVTLPSRMFETAVEEEPEAEAIHSEPVQIHNRFILSQIKSGFIVIDQQA